MANKSSSASSLQLVASLSVLVLLMVSVKTIDCLPDDIDIQGDGRFNMELTQLKNIKDMWRKLTDEADEVETPRPISGDDSSRVNVNMYEKIISEQDRLNKGGSNDDNKANQFLNSVTRVESTRRISPDLYQWIQKRAETIAHRYHTYATELDDVNNKMDQGRAMVTHILLLNTFVELDNLVKERFDSSFKSSVWIQKKLNMLKDRRELSLKAVKAWLEERFRQVLNIERTPNVRDTNYEWVANMRDIKRFMHEQRFSDEMAQQCVDFMKGEWQGYDRATRLELFKDDLSTGLNARGMLYNAFRGQLSFNLPFSVQDSILRGY